MRVEESNWLTGRLEPGNTCKTLMDFALVECNNCIGSDEQSPHKKNNVPNPEYVAIQAELHQLK